MTGSSRVNADATATFIVGGQVKDEAPDILLVYPEGNYIRASDERPFLQIGESKYGKFMLELGVRAHLSGDKALKMALSSMVSTAAPPSGSCLGRTVRTGHRGSIEERLASRSTGTGCEIGHLAVSPGTAGHLDRQMIDDHQRHRTSSRPPITEQTAPPSPFAQDPDTGVRACVDRRIDGQIVTP